MVASMALCATVSAADKATALFTPTNWGDNTVSISLRYLGGAEVTFSGLGTTLNASGTSVGPIFGTNVNRFYDDGQVLVDASGNVDGNSRLWAYGFPSQANATNGTIAMHSRRSESASDFSVTKDAGGSMGWEVSLGRRLGNFSRRTMWGIAGGFGFTDFRTEYAGKVRANLIETTDIYSLNGRTPPTAPYQSSASGADVVPISATPLSRTTTTTTGVNDLVNGAWKIKGAYFTLRAGPTVRTILAKRWSIQAAVGASITYVDSRYTITSQMEQLKDSAGNIIMPFNAVPAMEADKSKEVITVGFYADTNIEFWVTPRTGLYAGVALIQRGSFEQTAGFSATGTGGSKAEVDLGNGAGFQLGFIHRF